VIQLVCNSCTTDRLFIFKLFGVLNKRSRRGIRRFVPNEEAAATHSGVDEQQQSGVNDSSANQTSQTGVQNGTSDNVEQTGEGTNGDGENQTPESRPKPKRYRNELVKYLRTILYLCRDIYPSNLSKKNCVYFLRTTSGTISAPSSIEDTDKTMVKYLDFGLLNGHTLHLLANTLNKVRENFYIIVQDRR
ncbi:unnamed protein product, partial [Rotaria sp. Silwood2]